MHRTNKTPALVRAGCAAASHHMRAAAAAAVCDTTPLGASLIARASSHFAAAASSPIAASCAATSRSAAAVIARAAPASSSSTASASASATRLGSRFLSTIVSNCVPSSSAGSGYSVLLSGSSAALRGPVVASGALSSRPSRTYASMGTELSLLLLSSVAMILFSARSSPARSRLRLLHGVCNAWGPANAVFMAEGHLRRKRECRRPKWPFCCTVNARGICVPAL